MTDGCKDTGGRYDGGFDAVFMVGPDARVGREPGQARKGAAISAFGPVPSVARP
jgi:hypothetical protein